MALAQAQIASDFAVRQAGGELQAEDIALAGFQPRERGEEVPLVFVSKQDHFRSRVGGASPIGSAPRPGSGR